MHLYRAFGLVIGSARPLPELVESPSATPDVIIRWGKVEPVAVSSADGVHYFHIGPGRAYLCWDEVARFSVRKGKEITVEPFPRVEAQLVRLPLLGMVLAVLLLQRGMMVLHGSAMVVNNSAIAFLGNKGAGKSTLAMALYSVGHGFLTDDVVAVNSTELTLYPAFPQFKLWPDAAACSLRMGAETKFTLDPQMEKQTCQLTDRFLMQPVPLRQIYVLDINSKAEIRPFGPQDAIMALICNSYMARFSQLPRSLEVQNLNQCAELVKKVSTYRLAYPSSLASLPALTQLVEEHLTYCNFANVV